MADQGCILCGAGELEPVVTFGPVPVNCNRLLASEAEARAASRRTLDLVFCPSCSHLFNRSFDPSLVSYGPDYETSQHFSPRFQRFAEELADRLTARYGLPGKTVLEIGCGQGEFLAVLCARAGCRGLGFDQSYARASASPSLPKSVTLSSERSPPRSAYDQADLILCRHVLEHLPAPRELVAEIRDGLDGRTDVTAYVEVPNAHYTLEALGIWDLIYEHHSYFTAPSLARLFTGAGFAPLALEVPFDGQFLAIEARLAGEAEEAAQDAPGDPAEIAALVRAFPDRLQDTLARWRDLWADLAGAGQRVALWGAGSKGVTFLNLVAGDTPICGIVDLNPRKQGRYVPGAASPVIAPEALREDPPEVILVMNPIYHAEVAREAERLGVDARILGVD